MPQAKPSFMEFSSNSPRPPKPVNKRLFVGGLPYKFTEGQLLDLFVPFGRIISLKIIRNQWGKSRGIGYIEFDVDTSAIDAKKALHNHHVTPERTIIVDYADPDPFNTPEGQARHLEALQKKSKFSPDMVPVFHPDADRSRIIAKPHFKKSKTIEKPLIPPNRGKHLRQSVFLSRYHGSKVGAKFAAKTRAKKSR